MAAIGNYPIARSKLGNTSAHLNYGTHVAVAQCQRLVKLAAHRIYRGHWTVGAHLAEQHLDLVGLLPCPVEHRSTTEVDQHALGARGDQCALRSDQHMTSLERGDGSIDQRCCARTYVQKYLLHGTLKGDTGQCIPAWARHSTAHSLGLLSGWYGLLCTMLTCIKLCPGERVALRR